LVRRLDRLNGVSFRDPAHAGDSAAADVDSKVGSGTDDGALRLRGVKGDDA
jgi:hypothetical protein